MPVPVTMLEFREWQRSGRLRQIREDCGISGEDIAIALGMNRTAVYAWETVNMPMSAITWAAYMRIIRGMMNHLEVPEEGGCS